MLARLLKRLLLLQIVGVVLIGTLLATFTDLSDLSAWAVPVLLLPALPAFSMTRCFFLGWRHQGTNAPPSLLRDWLRAGVSDIVWTWRLYLWRQPLAPRLLAQGFGIGQTGAVTACAGPKRSLTQHAASDALPVLLIHGFFCNHRVWDAMAAHLSALGHPVWRLDLEPLHCSIDDYAPRIDAAVTAMLAQRADSRFYIIGHSMGGLATRAWLRAFPDRLRSLCAALTLGTPHIGTQVDPGARFANTRQMIYHSPWLTELAQSESTALRERFSVCITPQDQIVFPQTEQWLPGMRVHTISGIGHLEMCTHPAVLTWVSTELTRASRTGLAPE